MNDFLGTLTGQEKNESLFPSLTLKERLIGFAVCFGLGVLIQFLSMGSLLGLVVGKANKFAFLYTVGNIISIIGTFFLVGPLKQFQNMKDESRFWTSITFVSSIILTLISLYFFNSKILIIVFVFIQFCAYIWYVLSYIPYGRDIMKRCLKGFWRGG
jgi:ribose/xylose/arabinose/galactoside ABC-type transport system permease subunit